MVNASDMAPQGTDEDVHLHSDDTTFAARTLADLAERMPDAPWVRPKSDGPRLHEEFASHGRSWLELKLSCHDPDGLAMVLAMLDRFGLRLTRYTAEPAYRGTTLRLSLGFADDAASNEASRDIGERAEVLMAREERAAAKRVARAAAMPPSPSSGGRSGV